MSIYDDYITPQDVDDLLAGKQGKQEGEKLSDEDLAQLMSATSANEVNSEDVAQNMVKSADTLVNAVSAVDDFFAIRNQLKANDKNKTIIQELRKEYGKLIVDFIKKLTKVMVRENKNVTFQEVQSQLKALGFNNTEIALATKEINFQLSWLGKKANKLLHLGYHFKKKFSLKENTAATQDQPLCEL